MYMNVKFYVLNVMHSSVFEKDENKMWKVLTEAERNVLIYTQLAPCWQLFKSQRTLKWSRAIKKKKKKNKPKPC